MVEIDPGVTKAAFAAFGLESGTTINTISLDGRNYIDGLIEQQHRGLQPRRYDFIYEDALNDYSVPYQLTTKEFNDKLYCLLAEDGIYMVELIDTFDSALFLGSMVNTLGRTFPFIAVISQNNVTSGDRSTYVVVAAKRKLDLNDVCKGFEIDQVVWYLNDSEIAQLIDKSRGAILTDDYAPVENMLAPVALRNVENRSDILAEHAKEYASQGNLRQAMRKLDTLARSDPAFSIGVFGVVAQIFVEQGRTDETVKIFKAALGRFTDSKYDQQMLALRYNYAVFFKNTGKMKEAAEQFDKTGHICEKILAERPREAGIYSVLGNIFAEKGDFTKAVESFRRALDLEPDKPENHTNLIQALEVGGNLDTAIQAAQKSVEYFQARNRVQDAENIRQYLNQLKTQK